VPPKAPLGGLILLDACCLINLFASGGIEAVLQALPYRFATSRLVAEEEVLAIGSVAGTAGRMQREVVSPRALARRDLLTILPITSEREQAAFVRFALDLDDGEASVCALATVHGGGVATDDRKALRILEQVAPEIPVLQTPELVYEWASRSRAPTEEIRAVLGSIRTRGRFHPRREAPHADWWNGYS
jgi:hypothetical protein